MENYVDDIFNDNLEGKMEFLSEKKTISSDGIYRIDLSKVKNKEKGYKSVVRFLPNLISSEKSGQVAIEKITHYVNMKNNPELSGYYDSPKNFGEKCALSELYYNLKNSKNAILQEKSKCLNYSKKYYSYVLVLEDENQPELVGKIMIFQFGKIIKDKILSEDKGEISGVPCNVYSLSNGKDFVFSVREVSDGNTTYPDYRNSNFRPNPSPIQIMNSKGELKAVPTQDGKIEPKYHDAIKEFLLKRDYNLEDFAPKKLSDDQQGKVNEIISYLTGKSSNTFSNNSPSSDDFEMEEIPSTISNSKVVADDDDDDFFNSI